MQNTHNAKYALLAIVTLALFSACGSTKTGAASAGAGVGESCLGTTCEPGLTCGGTIFDRVCTVQCGSDSACEQFDPNARCFGGASGECALRCDKDGDCPTGTKCVATVSSATTPMACVTQ